METWIIYGFIAAILITSRDFFTSNYTSKYTVTEHLLYYYVLCGLAMSAYVCYRKVYLKEKVRLIDKEDLWKYAIVAGATVLLISPCEITSIREASNPGRARAIMNLNTIFLFLVSIYFLKNEKLTPKKLMGIVLTVTGIFMIF
tara:strand:+ start:69 stop:500 length:432 start_codon:yes stop_codon:yes gene_type:complete